MLDWHKREHGPEAFANICGCRREWHGVPGGHAPANRPASSVAADYLSRSGAWHHAVRPGRPPPAAHARGRTVARALPDASRLRVFARRRRASAQARRFRYTQCSRIAADDRQCILNVSALLRETKDVAAELGLHEHTASGVADF